MPTIRVYLLHLTFSAVATCAVAKEPDFPPAKSPEEALAAMVVRPGFQVELVAAEPLVMDPVAFDWGADGKLWVVEMADYPRGLDGKGLPGGRVRFLEDTDDDGRYDRSTLFLEALGFPTGVMAWRSGVLVSCAPEIFYAEDRDGDGRAEVREPLYIGFGQGNQQHRVNGFRWGLDNWIYAANGDSGGTIKSVKTGQTVSISGRDLRIRPDTGEIEPVTGQTQFVRDCDDWGNWFGSKNSNPLFHYVLPEEYLRRNPHYFPPHVVQEVPSVPGAAPVFPVSRTVARFNDLNKVNRFTSACGACLYRDELFGEAFIGNSFVCEPVHNLVHREVLTPVGATFTSRRADDEQTSEFLASTDNWFRPVLARTGPDGALWIADMYRQTIEHPEWIPPDWQKRLDLRAGSDKGRIYRVFPNDKPPRPILKLHRLPLAGLVDELEHPSGVVRDTAQRLFIERADKSIAPQLRRMTFVSPYPLARLHALCTLDGLGELDALTIDRTLEDPHAGVRRHALRLAAAHLTTKAEIVNRRVIDAVLKRIDDTDPQVRLQLAFTLGASLDPRAGTALGTLALSAADDPFLTAAVFSAARPETLLPMVESVVGSKTNTSEGLRGALIGLSAAHANYAALANLLTAARAESRFFDLRSLLDVLDRRGVAWEKFLQEAPSGARPAFERLADTFASAREVATNSKSDDAQRAAAIALLGRAPTARETDLKLLGKLLTPQNSLAVQSAAVAALARGDDRATPAILLASWKGLGPGVRGQILDAILARSATVEVLLDRIEAGDVLPAEIDASRVQRLVEHKDAAVRQRAKKLLAGSSNPDRVKVIESYLSALSLAGDSARGTEVFKKRCAACHKIGEVGHAVGPDLTALTDKSPTSLLVAILDPNKAVEAKFLNYTAVTNDGLTFTGMLVSETGSSITLLAAKGKEIPILRTELDILASSSKSLMPEGLEKDVAPQDLADLFAWLGTLRGAPKKLAGNEPRVVRPEALRGEFYLLPEQAEVYGKTLVIESRYGNLGYWQSDNDHAVWTMEVGESGKYDVSLEYACPGETARHRFVVSVQGQRLSGKVAGTGSWDDYRSVPIGQVTLAAGPQRLVVHADGKLTGPLMDLKSIRLRPKK